MNNFSRGGRTFSHSLFCPILLNPTNNCRLCSSSSSLLRPNQEDNNNGCSTNDIDNTNNRDHNAFSLVAAIKSSATSLRSGQPLHALALKSGLDPSNLFVRNALLNLYAKCGRLNALRRLFSSAPFRDLASWNIVLAAYAKSDMLDDARTLFDEMPSRDCVSFTTMIMGLAQGGRPVEALAVFHDMVVAGVMPNEVTLASAISACSRFSDIISHGGRMIHAIALKCGLGDNILVGTNLVHIYAVCSQLDDARHMFNVMSERNTVTWNVMLNGYAKAGLLSMAKDLFEKIPLKDLISWSTMIDAYLKGNKLEEAFMIYREMLRNSNARQNEVLIVDFLSTCARHCAFREGQQLHSMIVKTALDCHTFVQATLIHFYGACGLIDLACLQFQIGCKLHVSSWNALLAGLLRNNLVEIATKLFNNIPYRDVVSWSTIIAGYVHYGKSNLALEFFEEMQFIGCEPNEITLVSVLTAIADCGTLEQGKWIHDYIMHRSFPLTDNLSASLIDMYAKCGSIANALQVFGLVRNSASVSPWNAMICGLAMHGHADMSLHIFSDMQATTIKPNSITFIGVLSACCHNGLIAEGRRYFNAMRRDYHIEPTIKHYGCMVDLLCRAGCLEEAELLIRAMPMKADVVIWGSVLTAARACGNVQLGELAADSLARLEPNHGASRVLLSNIYADAGRWSDVIMVRTAMQSKSLDKMPGCSSINEEYHQTSSFNDKNVREVLSTSP